MGADISIRTVCERIDAEQGQPDLSGVPTNIDPREIFLLVFDKVRDHYQGAYFRDGCGSSGMLRQYGMDWAADVGPLLNDKWELCGADLQLFRDRLAGAAFAPNNEPTAFEAWWQKTIGQEADRGLLAISAPIAPRHTYEDRRDALLALLDWAIAAGEPVECSL